MILSSKLFTQPYNPKLEACATSDPAHIMRGAKGDHVQKIQIALKELDNLNIDAAELADKKYGQSTADAVLAFKKKRNIINPAYQTQEDDIVGKMTIATLDKEMLAKEKIILPPTVDNNAVVRRARHNSQAACYNAIRALERLLNDLDRAENMFAVQKVQFMANMMIVNARTVFVVKEFLKVNDPFSKEAREVYRKAIKLFNDNVNLPIQLVAEASNGPRCSKPAFAWTARYDPEPRISCCEPLFFKASEECRRDVVTHEVFHALGLIHVWERHPILTSDDALQDCNSLAQVAAFITDRWRNNESCAHHLQHHLPV